MACAIKMNSKEAGSGSVEWLGLCQDRDYLRDIASIRMRTEVL